MNDGGIGQPEYVNVIQDYYDGLIQGHPGSKLSALNDNAQPHDQRSVMLC